VLVHLMLLELLLMLMLAQRERGCIICANYRGRLRVCICLGNGWDRGTSWIEVAWWVIDAWEREGVGCWWGWERLVGYRGWGVEMTILGDLLHELGAVHRHSLHARKDMLQHWIHQ
jgi:hypothetical protein